jgi:putative glycosyltransferase (TIGR04372 family)
MRAGMQIKLKISQLLEQVKEFTQAADFEGLLKVANTLLAKDPYNGEYLLYKLQALDGLGKITADIKFLHHYANMRSPDITAFLLLYKAYMARDSIADAIISLVFALSIDPQDEECQSLLANLLAEVDPKYKTVKFNILITNRVGHLASDIEPWARSRQDTNDDCLYLFITDGRKTANDSLFTLLRNYAHVIESTQWFNFYLSRPLLLDDNHYVSLPYDLNGSLRGKSQISINKEGSKRLIDIYNNFPALVKIPNDDIADGWKMLEKYNLRPSDRIVCLHVRDSYYLEKHLPGNNYSHHDYRDADISTYKPAVLKLIDEGYKVVRIGADTNQYLDLNSTSYIDLCRNVGEQHSDFIELLLISVCDFFIATTSGPMSTAAIFDTPTLVVNAAPIHPPYFRNARFIPKRIFQNGIEVSLMDICRGKPLSEDNVKPILLCLAQKELVANGYEYLDNNEQDILLAVTEFSNQVNNRVFIGEATQAQKAYHEKLPDSFAFKDSRTLVCDSFLTKYPEIFK